MWKDVEQIKKIIKESKNKSEVLNKLGLKNNGGNYNTLSYFIMINNVDITHFENILNKNDINHDLYKNISNILTKNSFYRTTSHLKERLYKEGLKTRKCELCGQDEIWKGKKMSLILDHINGDRHDNRIENLRIVCPNCNSTLETHCRGLNTNKKKKYDICECGNKKRVNSFKCKECFIKNHKNEDYKNFYNQCSCGNLKKINNNSCKECNKKEQKTFLEKIKERRKIERPSYDILIKEIKDLGYVGTGRKYGVSDNSIRKWKKYYEIYGIDF